MRIHDVSPVCCKARNNLAIKHPRMQPTTCSLVLACCLNNACPCRLSRRVKLPGPLGRYNVYYKLLTARGWNAYKKNELNAEKITNMSLRLNYEAVVQYADIEDNDLLYFSYANQVRAKRVDVELPSVDLKRVR